MSENRLRTGHTRLREHLHRLKLVESPDCECGMGVDSIPHLFFECLDVEDERNTLLNEIETSFVKSSTPVTDRVFSHLTLLGDHAHLNQEMQEIFKTGADRVNYYKRKKSEEEKIQKQKKYNEMKMVYNARRRERRQGERKERVASACALRQRSSRRKRKEHEIKIKEQRSKDNHRKREYRKKLKALVNTPVEKLTSFEENLSGAFSSRTEKFRAMKKLELNLPETPRRRVSVLSSYLNKTDSPTVNTLQNLKKVITPEDEKSIKMADAVLTDLKDIVEDTKMKRTEDARATMNILSAAVNGENVNKAKCRIDISKKLGVSTRRLSTGGRIRTKVLRTEHSSWTFTARKTRTDSLSEEHKRTVYNFWISPEVSRPTGNKNDFKRVRLEAKVYSCHIKHVLEMTQTEAYLAFKDKYPEIKIGQRLFEKLKPYFVTQARPRDRQTCCCRYHVEARYLFKSCMAFRQKHSNDEQNYPVFEHLSDLVNCTLCDKLPGSEFHDKKCLERSCSDCGVQLFKVSDQELSIAESAPDVEWMRYEYVSVKLKGTERKKLMLMRKKTKPGEMFGYFLDILGKFAAHAFRAKWQSQQLQKLKQNLPKDHVICIHDFSENYVCKDAIEIQSSYFQKIEVSLHVSIIYRHANPETDNMSSSEEDPKIIEEHFFVISPDLQHDFNFTHECQTLVLQYLQSANSNPTVLHEFTDGCASQYKSRHCIGDLSYCRQDFNCQIIRNFFETSHAKGVQDAAGGLVKNQADFAVQVRKTVIQSAEDLYQFATSELSVPKKQDGCKRRLFRLLPSIARNRNRKFKPIPNVRKIHQVVANVEECNVFVRSLSCYSCENCMSGNYLSCTSCAESASGLKLEHENESTENPATDEDVELKYLIQPGVIVAAYTDDEEEDYYLIECSSAVDILDDVKTDCWGNTFAAGTEIVEGLYFDKVNGNPLKYKIIKNKPVMIPALSVRYICIGLKNKGGRIDLIEETHLDILSACEQNLYGD